MGFFDLIENTAKQADSQVVHPASGTVRVNRDQDLVGEPARRSASRPEQLKFLRPCSICGGRDFIHGRDGRFFCTICQPGITGTPVKAAGHRQTQTTVQGLPCAACGSTTYQRIENGFIFDDGTLADGWHCGGENCHVKLYCGNKKKDKGESYADSK